MDTEEICTCFGKVEYLNGPKAVSGQACHAVNCGRGQTEIHGGGLSRQHQVVVGELETIEVGRPAGRQSPAGLWLHDCGRTGLCSHISSVDTYFVRFSFRVHDLNVDRESRS